MPQCFELLYDMCNYFVNTAEKGTAQGIYSEVLEYAREALAKHYTSINACCGLMDLILLGKENNIELIILAGFMCILSQNFTSIFANRIINVHPALIPSFCGEGYYGLRVHEKALEYGVKVSGATVHFVNEIPDGGKIIMQKAVKVLEKDTPETLQKRIMKQAEWKILPSATEKVCKMIKKEQI